MLSIITLLQIRCTDIYISFQVCMQPSRRTRTSMPRPRPVVNPSLVGRSQPLSPHLTTPRPLQNLESSNSQMRPKPANNTNQKVAANARSKARISRKLGIAQEQIAAPARSRINANDGDCAGDCAPVVRLRTDKQGCG